VPLEMLACGVALEQGRARRAAAPAKQAPRRVASPFHRARSRGPDPRNPLHRCYKLRRWILLEQRRWGRDAEGGRRQRGWGFAPSVTWRTRREGNGSTCKEPSWELNGSCCLFFCLSYHAHLCAEDLKSCPLTTRTKELIVLNFLFLAIKQ
jgi:hypothetical protein